MPRNGITGARQPEGASPTGATAEERSLHSANLVVVGRRFLGARSYDEIHVAIQDVVANFVGSEEVAIYRVTPDGSTLAPVAAVGVELSGLGRVPFGEGPIGGAAACGRARHGSGRSHGEPLLCVPLRADGRAIGVIVIFCLLPQKPRLEWTDHEILEALASYAARALRLSDLEGLV